MVGLSYSPITTGLKLAKRMFTNARSKMFKCLIMPCKTVETNDLFKIKWREKNKFLVHM